MNERIKELRSALNLSQSAFAERINLTRSFVARVEINDRVPSDRTINDICREYNVNEHWLRTGEGDMFVPQSSQEEVAAFLGKLLSADGAEHLERFKLRLITAISQLSEAEWVKIKELADKLSKDD